MTTNIIVFDNNTKLVEKMQCLFEKEGYHILTAGDSEQVYHYLTCGCGQILLTDIMNGQEDVWDGLRRIKEIRKISNIPMIVVSGETEESLKILALNAGADDYCSMECSPLELLARVKCQLRRYLALIRICDNMEQVYKIDDLELNDNTRKVTVAKREVRLTPIEYKILRLLVRERGKVLSIEEIYRAIWQMKPVGADNTIAVHIRHIRQKIEANPKEPKYLKVVWGNGYMVG